MGIFDTIATVLGWLSIPLFLVSVFLMVRMIRKAHPLKSALLGMQALTPLLLLLVYVLLLSLGSSWIAGLAAAALGLAVGVGWSFTTKVQVHEGKPFGKRSGLYLVVWALSFAITQAMIMVAPTDTAAFAAVTMYFSAGLALGANGLLAMRASRAAASGASVS